MNILFAVSEMSPFFNIGERADVIGTLALALKDIGHKITVMLPGFSDINRYRYGFKSSELVIPIPIGRELRPIAVSSAEWNGITAYLLENDDFKHGNLYEDVRSNKSENGLRFACFSRGVIEAAKALRIKPDVVHVHEWQSAPVIAYLATTFADDPSYKNTAKLFTIHNLGDQGKFKESVFTMTGLPREAFSDSTMRDHGNVSFIKGGIVYADAISTVSEKYAEEITGRELGFGLQGVLSERRDDLYGIINGIDQDEWNPAVDKNIPANYSVEDLSGKEICRTELLEECGLKAGENTPLFGMVTTLNDQKGFDLLEKASERLRVLDMRFVILGMGNKLFHDALLKYESEYPERLKVILRSDKKMAHRIYAGADALLMPSRYEPCGLGQLIAMRYGTVPVVHATGGLADTVQDLYDDPENGNGISFKEYSLDALTDAVSRAVETFQAAGQTRWNRAVKKCMTQDFSWRTSARKYEELYNRIKKR